MKNIAFVGFKQVGKSTAAKYLADTYGYQRHNFKDALVAEIKQNFPNLLQNLSDLYSFTIDELFEIKPPAMRSLLQNYGTEVRRRDHEHYWVDMWTATLPEGAVVVDDVRFLNEADAVLQSDGIIVRLVRPDVLSGGSHASETEQLDIKADYTIVCTPGDHKALFDELDKLMK